MTTDQVEAIAGLLTQADKRLEFNGNPRGGDLASEIRTAKEEIKRATLMLRWAAKFGKETP